MKTAIIKSVLAVTSLIATGIPGLVSAHSQTGSLGSAASSTDYYQVTCSDSGVGAPANLQTQVKDQTAGAAPLVSVQAQKGSVATHSTDTTDNDANYSSWAILSGGSGVYTVLVDKDGAGAENYTLQAHCMTSGGVETGTTVVSKQNQ
jgi:hypothetical protein